MRLEFTNYDSPLDFFLKTPFRDGLANIDAAFRGSKTIHYHGLNSQNVRVSEEVLDRTLCDKIKLVFAGAILLIPVINIVADLALRLFYAEKDEEGDFGSFHFNLEGLNINAIQGGTTGLHQALDNAVSPRIIRAIRNGSFKYAISPHSASTAVTGSYAYVLHLKINQNGKSIEWRRKILVATTAESHINDTERDIARDVLTKLYVMNKGIGAF